MSVTREGQRSARPLDLVALSLAGLLLLGCMLGVWAGVDAIRAPKSDSMATFSLNGLTLSAPRSWLSGAVPDEGSRIDRLDLAIPLASASSGDKPPLETVLLTHIAPADGSESPASRAQSLYAQFLLPEVWTNPGGLLMRRFQPGSPYEGEELYLSVPDGRDFTARCSHQSTANTPLCLWTFRIGNTASETLDIQVSFTSDHLSNWKRLVARARSALLDLTGQR